MPIDKRLIAQTTAFGQNCLLNCAAHKIIEVLLNTDPKDLDENHPFNLIKDRFNVYYGFSAAPKSLVDLQQFFKYVENPIDREYILGPVLRHSVIAEVKKHRDGDYIFDHEEFGFKAVINDYSTTQSIEGTRNANLALSNQDFLKNKDAKYLEWKKEHPNGTEDDFIKDYWSKEGFAHYVNKLAADTELSVFEADMLLENLGIAITDYSNPTELEEYTPRVELPNYPEPTLELCLENGHWQYLERDANKAHEHNAHYRPGEEGEGYCTYAQGAVTYPPKFRDIILKNKTDAEQLRYDVISRVKAISWMLSASQPKTASTPIPSAQTDIPVKTFPVEVPTPEGKMVLNYMTDPNRKPSFEEERWMQIQNNATTPQAKPEVVMNKAGEEQPKTAPKPNIPPLPSSMMLKDNTTSPAPVQIKNDGSAKSKNSLRGISKQADKELKKNKGITVQREESKDEQGPDIITYSKGKEKTQLEVKDHEIACPKPNNLAKTVLIEHIVQLAIKGMSFSVEGGTTEYIDDLKAAAIKEIKNFAISKDKKDAAEAIIKGQPEVKNSFKPI